MSDTLPLSALILAGGRSSRMGRDKALLTLAGQTMLERICAHTALLFKETLVIVDDEDKTSGLRLGAARVFTDLFTGKGPMAGIYTGLRQSRSKACCVLTCDMPFIEAGLLRRLCGAWREDCDAACFQETAGASLPFPGVYSRSSRFLMRMLLENRESAMLRFLGAARIKHVPLGRIPRDVLLNMNTPEDYQNALDREHQGRAAWIAC